MRRWLVVGAAGGVLLAGGTVATLRMLDASPPLRVPTVAEAQAALDRAFTAAQRGDRERFCETVSAFPPLCRDFWDSAGGTKAVPAAAPRVAGDRELDGHRVLLVCGTDGLGRPYRSDFPVDFLDGRLRVLLATFWYGHHFSGTRSPGHVETVSPTRAGDSRDCKW